MQAMQGLATSYNKRGRAIEWRRLVAELLPDLADPATGGPLPDREAEWEIFTEYRAAIATAAYDLVAAEHLVRNLIAARREQAAAALAVPPERLDESQRRAIRNLAGSLEYLGSILREIAPGPGSVQLWLEATALFQRIGNRRGEGIVAFNLGIAYKATPGMRDLGEAVRWFKRASELFEEHDTHGHALVTCQIGDVAHERFVDAREAGAAREQLLRYLNEAAAAYFQALELLPADAAGDLAVTHGRLGRLWADVGDTGRATSHYQRSIQYCESQDDRRGAGMARFNTAHVLSQVARGHDALLYARAALRDFESAGPGAAAEADRARQLITDLERESAR